MGIFDPAAYQGIRRQVERAESLPPHCYSSEAFHRREVERIFLRAWNLVGRTDYVPRPGDYFTVDLVGIPVVVIRGRDGVVRAFVNSCRHRGTKLLDGDGHSEAIACPYHSWVYDTQGQLRAAPGAQEMTGFTLAEGGLTPVRMEVWLGFVFICFAQDAPPLADYLGDLADHLRSYDFESMVTVRRATFEVKSNWKLYVENSMENFHLPTVHRNSIGDVKAVWTPIVGDPGNYLILHSKTERSRATLSGETGFDRIPSLSGRAAEGAQYVLVYPATVLGCDFDCMWFKQMVPDGPGRMRNIAAFCFPRTALERADYAEVIQRYHRRFERVIAEDNAISERQFAGLNHSLARAGRLSGREPLVHAIDNWILDRVLDPPAFGMGQ